MTKKLHLLLMDLYISIARNIFRNVRHQVVM